MMMTWWWLLSEQLGLLVPSYMLASQNRIEALFYVMTLTWLWKEVRKGREERRRTTTRTASAEARSSFLFCLFLSLSMTFRS